MAPGPAPCRRICVATAMDANPKGIPSLTYSRKNVASRPARLANRSGMQGNVTGARRGVAWAVRGGARTPRPGRGSGNHGMRLVYRSASPAHVWHTRRYVKVGESDPDESPR